MKKWIKPALNVTLILTYYYFANRYPSDFLTIIYALLAWNRVIEKLLELLD